MPDDTTTNPSPTDPTGDPFPPKNPPQPAAYEEEDDTEDDE